MFLLDVGRQEMRHEEAMTTNMTDELLLLGVAVHVSLEVGLPGEHLVA